MTYDAFKVVHLFGVILFLGNVIVTAVWKVMADRTGDPRVIAYAQRLVTLTDWMFTAGGAVLLLVGAYGMTAVAGLDLRGPTWLIWGQALFVVSGLIWLCILIPTQIAQAREARAFASGAYSRKLLAAQSALGSVGSHRHACLFGEPLFYGLQAVRFDARSGRGLISRKN